MSSFWSRVTGGTDETPPVPLAPAPLSDAEQSATVAAAPVSPKPAWGIAKANELMSTLPDSGNDDLVLRVIRKTLESVGVHVGELIVDARSREGELGGEIERRRGTIGDLERQIGVEREAIAALEREMALTSRTRDGLERSAVLGDADLLSIPPDEPR